MSAELGRMKEAEEARQRRRGLRALAFWRGKGAKEGKRAGEVEEEGAGSGEGEGEEGPAQESG